MTVKGIKAGAAYVTAKRNGAIDVIKIVVIKKYPAVKGAVTSGWCAQYRCSHTNCTISDRAVKNVPPNRSLLVYGESGGFYYAKVAGESDCWFMWKNNVSVNWGSWTKMCSLQNRNAPGGDYAPQGFAVDDQYAYSFEIRNNNSGNHHRLFRYNFNTGELVQMQPNTQIDLMHANDAAVVTFRENGKDQKYLFVTKCESLKDCSIIKLAVDDVNREYRFVAEYPVERSVSGITLMSGGGNQPAVFLLNANYSFFRTTIANNLVLGSGQSLPMNLQFSIDSNFPQLYSAINMPQGIHYEPTNDRLYLPFSANSDHNKFQGSFTSVIRCYNNVSTLAGTINENIVYECTQSPYFEIEGVGFRTGPQDRRLWFNTFDNYANGGIYTHPSVMKP